MISKKWMKRFLCALLVASALLWALRFLTTAVYCPERGVEGIALRPSPGWAVRQEIPPPEMAAYTYLMQPRPTRDPWVIEYLWLAGVYPFVATSALSLLAVRYAATRNVRPAESPTSDRRAWIKWPLLLATATSLGLLLLRLFSVVIVYPGDGLSAIAFRFVPGLDNKVVVDDEPSFRHFFVLGPDHDWSREIDLYSALIDQALPASTLFALALFAWQRFKR